MHRKLVVLAVVALGVLGLAQSNSGALPVPKDDKPGKVTEDKLTQAKGKGHLVNANSSIEELTLYAPRPFHDHAVTNETTYAGSYVGMKRTKSEAVIRYQDGGSPCLGPIYQPQWLTVNGPGTSWVETGTAHWCDGSRSWYGFYAVNFNINVPTGTLAGGIWAFNTPITGSTTHTQSIERSSFSCAHWGLYVDTTLMAWANLNGCYIGTEIEVGAESYTPWAVLDGHGTYSYDVAGRLWDGAASIWYQPANMLNTYAGYQMYFRQVPINGVVSGATHCQNIIPANCG